MQGLGVDELDRCASFCGVADLLRLQRVCTHWRQCLGARRPVFVWSLGGSDVDDVATLLAGALSQPRQYMCLRPIDLCMSPDLVQRAVALGSALITLSPGGEGSTLTVVWQWPAWLHGSAMWWLAPSLIVSTNMAAVKEVVRRLEELRLRLLDGLAPDPEALRGLIHAIVQSPLLKRFTLRTNQHWVHARYGMLLGHLLQHLGGSCLDNLTLEFSEHCPPGPQQWWWSNSASDGPPPLLRVLRLVLRRGRWGGRVDTLLRALEGLPLLHELHLDLAGGDLDRTEAERFLGSSGDPPPRPPEQRRLRKVSLCLAAAHLGTHDLLRWLGWVFDVLAGGPRLRRCHIDATDNDVRDVFWARATWTAWLSRCCPHHCSVELDLRRNRRLAKKQPLLPHSVSVSVDDDGEGDPEKKLHRPHLEQAISMPMDVDDGGGSDGEGDEVLCEHRALFPR